MSAEEKIDTEQEQQEQQQTPQLEKYYDVDEIWNEKANPDDELTKYELALKMGERILIAHMIVDPLLEITSQQIKYMLREGFVEQKRTTVLRKNIDDEDIRLLRKSQFIDPEKLK